MAQVDSPSMARILVADSISDSGVELLRSTPNFEVTVKTGLTGDELLQAVREHDGLIVRSATKVTAEVLRDPGRLRVIGRAGTGVDNIDLEAATGAGVVVMNTPGGNSIAAAELTLALLLALARNVPQANADLRDGEWARKKYMGTEVAGKVLGVVGLGRIGREVARRAQGFRMEVVGYDPYVTAEAAADFGVRFLPLEQLLGNCDILSLHIPRTEETRHMIDAAALQRMKPGSRIINCARGGLIDEAALLESIESGHLAGAALDVFESEPPELPELIAHPHVVSTPHLGASTTEAQVRVGTEIAEKIRDFIQSGVILDAVNFPSVGREEYAELGPLMRLAEQLGSLLSQIAEGGFRRLDVRTLGSFADHALRPVVMAATKGLLTPLVEGPVSYVNALALGEARGIKVDEGRSSEVSRYAGLLRLTLDTESGGASLAGTIFSPDRLRLVEVDGVPIEAEPSGHMLLCRNRDVPGVLGKIGTLLGQAGVNIAGIQLGVPEGGEDAISILSVDSAVSREILERIRGLEEIVLVREIQV